MSTLRDPKWTGDYEQRRKALADYANREKIGELRQIASSGIPFDTVTRIRSGYGTIKQIECMEYFSNLRELLLCNSVLTETTTISKSSKA